MKRLLFFALCLSGLASAQTFTNPTLYSIPDDSMIGVQSDILVALTKTIADPAKVTVKLDLTHTYIGDLTIGLVVPGGPATGPIALIKRLGSTFPNSLGYTANFEAGNVIGFNSAAAGPIIPPGFVVPAGTYLPSEGLNLTPAAYTVANLGTIFTNLAVNGTWSLKLFDNGGGDIGSINNWQVVFDAGTFLGVDTAITSTPGLTVMGNPFRDTLDLKVNTAAKDVKFDIYSIEGKKVYSYQQTLFNNSNGNLKISTENWSAGNYILTPIVNGEKLMSIKLIKK